MQDKNNDKKSRLIGEILVEKGVIDKKELKAKLLDKCNHLDFKQLAKEVEPFLFTPHDSRKVLFFKDYVDKI